MSEHTAREIKCEYDYRGVYVAIHERTEGTYWWQALLQEDDGTELFHQLGNAPTFEIAKERALKATDMYCNHQENITQ